MVFTNWQRSLSPRHKMVLSFLLVLVMVLLVWQFTRYRPGGRVKEGDYLIYKMDGALFLYTPYTNEHRPLLEGWSIESFTLKNEWLAFSFNNNVYLLDYPFINTPQQITPEEFDKAYPDSWSTDGRYLAYETIHQDITTLWLWDNSQQQANAIYHYPTTHGVGRLSWGPQRQLTFTRYYGFVSSAQPDEVFIWDGQNIVNLSQNPTNQDSQPTWNSDGQLAFLSQIKERHYQIFIWDGVSKVDGVPDKSSFTNLASHLTNYASSPYWSPSGSLIFTGSHHAFHVIYEWDGQQITDLSRNPEYHNGSPTWSEAGDGYWAFATFFSKEDLVYVRNHLNNTVFTANGQSPSWSEQGLLAFCTRIPYKQTLKIAHWDNFLAEIWAGSSLKDAYNRTATPASDVLWFLSIWIGGTKSIKIMEANSIEASWSNGHRTSCLN